MPLVFLVHGYSVNRTSTYGQLHRQLALQGFEPEEIMLGRYVSLDDALELRDLARALDRAVRAVLRTRPAATTFHMLTHSTGALIAKHWLLEHYNSRAYPRSRLGNLLFLAGPHFGSRLAHHGRSVIARAWREGAVGRRILNALELGSRYAWDCNLRLAREPDFFASRGIRPYCLTGDRVSRDLLRHVSLAREKGSDEVVRVASGNLNFRHYRLDMLREQRFEAGQPAAELSGIPFAALRGYRHSGSTASILQSIPASALSSREIDKTSQADSRLNLQLILHLLGSGTDEASYSANRELLRALTDNEARRLTDFAQLQLRLRDRSGRPLEDYFVEFGRVRDGRERDRYGVERSVRRIIPSRGIAHIHRNTIHGHLLTLFIERPLLVEQELYGMRVRIDDGPLLHYEPQEQDPAGVASFSGRELLSDILRRHSTTLMDVTLDRVPGQGLFSFSDARQVVDELAVDNAIEQALLVFSRSRDFRRLGNTGRMRALAAERRRLERQRVQLALSHVHDYHVQWRRDGRISRGGLRE